LRITKGEDACVWVSLMALQFDHSGKDSFACDTLCLWFSQQRTLRISEQNSRPGVLAPCKISIHNGVIYKQQSTKVN
jgi:hypothetical protein